jgi:hypothetical protein
MIGLKFTRVGFRRASRDTARFARRGNVGAVAIKDF